MKNQNLYINDTDIKELFMNDKVDEILLTTDLEVFNMTEENCNLETIDDCDWNAIVDFGMKNIICEKFHQVEKVPYDQVTAVCVRYVDADKYGNEVETFINKNFYEVIKINY